MIWFTSFEYLWPSSFFRARNSRLAFRDSRRTRIFEYMNVSMSIFAQGEFYTYAYVHVGFWVNQCSSIAAYIRHKHWHINLEYVRLLFLLICPCSSDRTCFVLNLHSCANACVSAIDFSFLSLPHLSRRPSPLKPKWTRAELHFVQ